MALVVEDGTGKSDAESYVSVADVDSYLQSVGKDGDWSNKTQTEKEQALRLGSRYLDFKFRNQWRGFRTHRDQSLAWPRAFVQDEDGFSVDSDVVPSEIKNAAAELAERSLSQALLPDNSDGSRVTQESVTVGPIKESKTYSGGTDSTPEFVEVRAMIGGLIRGSRGLVTDLERA